MCDRIKDGDDRLKSDFIQKDSCIQNENVILQNCLNNNNHNWSKCKKELEDLRFCYNNKNKSNESDNNQKTN